MTERLDFRTARRVLMEAVTPLGTECVGIESCCGRILAKDLIAAENVPAFDRSAYDGYALRATDTLKAGKDAPVCLSVLENLPAGMVPTREVVSGTATRVMTGAPIPHGADAVVMFEKTAFTEKTVSIYGRLRSGENVVRIGEDIFKGKMLARKGERIDPGTLGALAAQNAARPEVYRIPRVAIITTGSEVAEVGDELKPGQIRNSNRYIMEAACRRIGCMPVYIGKANDSVEEICALIKKGLASCDAVISTGGVSAGDCDLTPDAIETAGGELLFRGVDLKPGMACAYGIYDEKIICALSGNPAAALTNFYAIAMPALKKMAGWSKPEPDEIDIVLADGFSKKSPYTRLLRGRLELSGGRVSIRTAAEQGNAVISSAVGCDAVAIIPAGSGAVCAGTMLKGFLI